MVETALHELTAIKQAPSKSGLNLVQIQLSQIQDTTVFVSHDNELSFSLTTDMQLILVGIEQQVLGRQNDIRPFTSQITFTLNQLTRKRSVTNLNNFTMVDHFNCYQRVVYQTGLLLLLFIGQFLPCPSQEVAKILKLKTAIRKFDSLLTEAITKTRNNFYSPLASRRGEQCSTCNDKWNDFVLSSITCSMMQSVDDSSLI